MDDLEQAKKALSILKKNYLYFNNSFHKADKRKAASILLEIEALKNRIKKLQQITLF